MGLSVDLHLNLVTFPVAANYSCFFVVHHSGDCTLPSIIRTKRRIASGELGIHDTGQKTVLTRSAITPPKVNGFR